MPEIRDVQQLQQLFSRKDHSNLPEVLDALEVFRQHSPLLMSERVYLAIQEHVRECETCQQTLRNLSVIRATQPSRVLQQSFLRLARSLE